MRCRPLPDRATLIRDNPRIEADMARHVVVGSPPYAGCQVWDGGKTPEGYGLKTIKLDGRFQSVYAHRVAYILAQGSLDPAKEINHLCGNPSCVNPEHLHPCTPALNRRDAAVARRIERHVRERGGVIGSYVAKVFRFFDHPNVRP